MIKILKNAINLGFAKGNNTGIKYVRKELKADLIFILNSDTVLNKSLFEDINRYYYFYSYAIQIFFKTSLALFEIV